MKIDRLELYGFKRLMLNNIKHFVYTPSSPQQLILGTNGSGKSSILSELSPLPAHQSNYTKDGYKKITISHLGRLYQLESIFKTSKHSFVLDGEELNPGGTGEVQKSLAFQHFGINKDIHELLTGEVRLSQLGAAERRKWITQISRADYSYAMGAFKRISGRARDQQGALKHLKQRLAQEIHNLQTMQNDEGLEERAAKLREELNHLMLERIPNLPSLDAQRVKMQELFESIEASAQEFFKNPVFMPSGKTYLSNEDVGFDLQRLDTNIHSTQAMIQRMGDEFSDMQAVVNSVQMDAGESMENLPELIREQQEELSFLRDAQEVFKELNSPSEIQRDWQAIGDEVQMTFRQLPDNADRRYSRESVAGAQEEIKRLENAIAASQGRVNQINNKIEAMNEAKELQCPSCTYVWRPGYSDQEMTDLLRNRQDHIGVINGSNERIKHLTAFIEECAGYMELYQRFRGYTQGYPRLQPLWDYILSNQLLLNNPKGNLSLFAQWARDLEYNVKHELARKRLAHYQEIQERQNAVGDTAHFTRRMRTLQTEIEQATADLLKRREDRATIERFFRKLQRLQEIAQRMENDYTEIERIRSVLIDALRNEVIDETVNVHQLELGGIMRRISEKEGQEGIVRDLESSKAEVELDAKALSIMVQALSPNEGLIAEQLARDIGCLVAQLNSIIGSIWTYDMTVLSCGLDSGELDYKFPLKVHGHAEPPSDVRRGSKGQQQMVNLAFHLTVMLYAGLEGYPLFLDEPGEGFDEQHRVKLMDFVKQLMDMNRHSQLFMISHYASSHGSFTNAEVLVLDSSNISVPGSYNQHAVLA